MVVDDAANKFRTTVQDDAYKTMSAQEVFLTTEYMHYAINLWQGEPRVQTFANNLWHLLLPHVNSANGNYMFQMLLIRFLWLGV